VASPKTFGYTLVLQNLIHVQTLDLTTFLTYSVDLNMDTISGTTHIKTIFSFWTGTGRHFRGNALCSFDDFVTHLIHIMHFSTINSLLHAPRRNNPEESSLENKGAREWVPFFLFNDQETPCPERHEHDGRSGVVHRLTGKFFSQGNGTKQCSPLWPEMCHQSP
jgi:hypothetical protein